MMNKILSTILISVIVVCMLSLNVQAQDSTATNKQLISLTLEKGWNLIALPTSVSATSLSTTNIAGVWGYDPETKQYIASGTAEFEALKEKMHGTMAIFVDSKTPGIIQIAGGINSTDAALISGTNILPISTELIGHSLAELIPTDATAENGLYYMNGAWKVLPINATIGENLLGRAIILDLSFPEIITLNTPSYIIAPVSNYTPTTPSVTTTTPLTGGVTITTPNTIGATSPNTNNASEFETKPAENANEYTGKTQPKTGNGLYGPLFINAKDTSTYKTALNGIEIGTKSPLIASQKTNENGDATLVSGDGLLTSLYKSYQPYLENSSNDFYFYVPPRIGTVDIKKVPATNNFIEVTYIQPKTVQPKTFNEITLPFLTLTNHITKIAGDGTASDGKNRFTYAFMDTENLFGNGVNEKYDLYFQDANCPKAGTGPGTTCARQSPSVRVIDQGAAYDSTTGKIKENQTNVSSTQTVYEQIDPIANDSKIEMLVPSVVVLTKNKYGYNPIVLLKSYQNSTLTYRVLSEKNNQQTTLTDGLTIGGTKYNLKVSGSSAFGTRLEIPLNQVSNTIVTAYGGELTFKGKTNVTHLSCINESGSATKEPNCQATLSNYGHGVKADISMTVGGVYGQPSQYTDSLNGATHKDYPLQKVIKFCEATNKTMTSADSQFTEDRTGCHSIGFDKGNGAIHPTQITYEPGYKLIQTNWHNPGRHYYKTVGGSNASTTKLSKVTYDSRNGYKLEGLSTLPKTNFSPSLISAAETKFGKEKSLWANSTGIEPTEDYLKRTVENDSYFDGKNLDFHFKYAEAAQLKRATAPLSLNINNLLRVKVFDSGNTVANANVKACKDSPASCTSRTCTPCYGKPTTTNTKGLAKIKGVPMNTIMSIGTKNSKEGTTLAYFRYPNPENKAETKFEQSGNNLTTKLVDWNGRDFNVTLTVTDNYVRVPCCLLCKSSIYNTSKCSNDCSNDCRDNTLGNVPTKFLNTKRYTYAATDTNDYFGTGSSDEKYDLYFKSAICAKKAKGYSGDFICYRDSPSLRKIDGYYKPDGARVASPTSQTKTVYEQLDLAGGINRGYNVASTDVLEALYPSVIVLAENVEGWTPIIFIKNSTTLRVLGENTNRTISENKVTIGGKTYVIKPSSTGRVRIDGDYLSNYIRTRYGGIISFNGLYGYTALSNHINLATFHEANPDSYLYNYGKYTVNFKGRTGKAINGFETPTYTKIQQNGSATISENKMSSAFGTLGSYTSSAVDIKIPETIYPEVVILGENHTRSGIPGSVNTSENKEETSTEQTFIKTGESSLQDITGTIIGTTTIIPTPAGVVQVPTIKKDSAIGTVGMTDNDYFLSKLTAKGYNSIVQIMFSPANGTLSLHPWNESVITAIWDATNNKWTAIIGGTPFTLTKSADGQSVNIATTELSNTIALANGGKILLPGSFYNYAIDDTATKGAIELWETGVRSTVASTDNDGYIPITIGDTKIDPQGITVELGINGYKYVPTNKMNTISNTRFTTNYGTDCTYTSNPVSGAMGPMPYNSNTLACGIPLAGQTPQDFGLVASGTYVSLNYIQSDPITTRKSIGANILAVNLNNAGKPELTYEINSEPFFIAAADGKSIDQTVVDTGFTVFDTQPSPITPTTTMSTTTTTTTTSTITTTTTITPTTPITTTPVIITPTITTPTNFAPTVSNSKITLQSGAMPLAATTYSQDTVFTFSATACDPEGNAPTSAKVIVNGISIPATSEAIEGNCFKLTADSTIPSTGTPIVNWQIEDGTNIVTNPVTNGNFKISTSILTPTNSLPTNSIPNASNPASSQLPTNSGYGATNATPYTINMLVAPSISQTIGNAMGILLFATFVYAFLVLIRR